MAPVTRCPASRCPTAVHATATAITAVNGAAAPIANMPTTSHSHRGTSKIHGGKSHGSPQTLTGPACNRAVGRREIAMGR